MQKFDKLHDNELKQLLRNSYIHDAHLLRMQYNDRDKEAYVIAANKEFRQALYMTFQNIQVIFLHCEERIRADDTIFALSVENNLSYLQNYMITSKSYDNMIYMVFEMISGEEIHIVCQDVLIDICTEDSAFDIAGDCTVY